MAGEPRLVTSRQEWDQLASLASSIYHQFDWASNALARLTVPGARVGYLRVWSGSSMIGCPVLGAKGRWVTVGRTRPEVLSGAPLPDPAAAFARAAATVRTKELAGLGRLVVGDDSAQLAAIGSHHRQVQRRADDTRRFLNMTVDETAARLNWADWDDRSDFALWLKGCSLLWRGAWRTEGIEYRRAGEPIGFAWLGQTPGHSTCFGVIRRGQSPHDWVSPR